MSGESPIYRPTMSDDDAQRLGRWHEAAYEQLRARGRVCVSYLGRVLEVPENVFAPTPMSHLLGKAVLDETRPDDRVLDMGTGCGVNAILAASTSSDVLGVDINPHAVAAARENAVRNQVADRTRLWVSDGFEAVKGAFDLIVIDPPFRWFKPRDLIEASIADENYKFLTRFIQAAPSYLNAGGRILLFFGNSGDIEYLNGLVAQARFRRKIIAEQTLFKDDLAITYSTQLLTL